MAIITLTSDYGTTDHHTAAVKGAILSELADVQLVDVTHTIQPGNLLEAAFIIRNCYRSFPEGTVHIISAGEITGNNRLLAVKLDGQYFLSADNGFVTLINPELQLKKVIEINFKQDISLFPSRDILARSAAHLARGGNITLLGREVEDYQHSTIMRPRITNDGSVILGSVVYVDNFGNLITNISKRKFNEVGKERSFEIKLPRNKSINKIVNSYYPSSAGSVLALFNSQQLLEIAISNARGKDFNGANTLLGLNVQDTISVAFK